MKLDKKVKEGLFLDGRIDGAKAVNGDRSYFVTGEYTVIFNLFDLENLFVKFT